MVKPFFSHIYGYCLVLILVLIVPVSSSASSKSSGVFKVAIHAISYELFFPVVGGKGCSAVSDIELETHDRNITELVILCRALTIQGLDPKLELVPAPNYSRGLRMVDAGLVHTVSESVWSKDVSPDAYATVDVIRLGEFEKGIYVNPGHELLKVDFQSGILNNYVGLTYKKWTYDWQIISSLTKNVVPVVRRASLFSMLEAKRADFTLWEFRSNVLLDIEYAGMSIAPIPGIKVVIPDSRKMVVSKKIEDGRYYFDMINSGLKVLRKSGELRALYEQGGFISQMTQDWEVINTSDWRVTKPL